MRAAIGLALLCVGAPSAAFAGDLSAALKIIKKTDIEVSAQYDDFIDSDPDEALALILEGQGVLWEADTPKQKSPSFNTLGNVRLSYQQLAGVIRDAAKKTGLPAGLIDAVIRTESGYRPNAVSRVGAQGLMQLMPATARSVGVRDAFDPRQNVLGGAKYLRKMYDKFKSLPKAIAAYNAGPGAVRKYRGIPPYKETRRYVQVVLRRYRESKVDD